MKAKNPLLQVKETFGDKEKLVAAIEALTKDDLWLARTNTDKGLAHVSNAKLLKLHATFTAVKAKFGTRDKLIGAILEIEKRTKDDGYKSRLAAFPVPRLWDMYKSAEKRVRTTPKPAAAKAEKKPAAKAAAKAPKAAAAKPAKKAAAKSAKK